MLQKSLDTSRNTLKDFWVQWGNVAGRDKWRGWDWHIHTDLYKIVKVWGPPVQHRELYSVLSDALYGKRIWTRMDIYHTHTHTHTQRYVYKATVYLSQEDLVSICPLKHVHQCCFLWFPEEMLLGLFPWELFHSRNTCIIISTFFFCFI